MHILNITWILHVDFGYYLDITCTFWILLEYYMYILDIT